MRTASEKLRNVQAVDALGAFPVFLVQSLDYIRRYHVAGAVIISVVLIKRRGVGNVYKKYNNVTAL